MSKPGIRVGDLRADLRLFDDNDRLIFGEDGNLTYFSLKNRNEGGAPAIVQIQFNERYKVIEPPSD